MLNSLDFFNILPGTWTFKRDITNNINPDLSGIVTGESMFNHTQEFELKYIETGIFIVTMGNSFKISNEYYFVYNLNKNQLEKYFSINNQKSGLFYKLGSDDTAKHLCMNDTYHAIYTLNDIENFILTYHVSGPQKDYVSTTTYLKS